MSLPGSISLETSFLGIASGRGFSVYRHSLMRQCLSPLCLRPDCISPKSKPLIFSEGGGKRQSFCCAGGEGIRESPVS